MMVAAADDGDGDSALIVVSASGAVAVAWPVGRSAGHIGRLNCIKGQLDCSTHHAAPRLYGIVRLYIYFRAIRTPWRTRRGP